MNADKNTVKQLLKKTSKITLSTLTISTHELDTHKLFTQTSLHTHTRRKNETETRKAR